MKKKKKMLCPVLPYLSGFCSNRGNHCWAAYYIVVIVLSVFIIQVLFWPNDLIFLYRSSTFFCEKKTNYRGTEGTPELYCI